MFIVIDANSDCQYEYYGILGYDAAYYAGCVPMLR